MDACLTEASNPVIKRSGLECGNKILVPRLLQEGNFSIVGEHVFQLGDDPQLDWLMERPLCL